ncbi:MAG: hypothetical protein ACLS37_08310 [Alistipes sp.]
MPVPANPQTSTDHEPSKTQLCPSLAAILSTAIPAAQRNVWNGRPADNPNAFTQRNRVPIPRGRWRGDLRSAEGCPGSAAAINDFRRWLQAQVVMPPEMPDSCEQGTVVARFVVERTAPPHISKSCAPRMRSAGR